MSKGDDELLEAYSQNIWLRAFYGFDPEGAGYIGFTHEGDGEEMLSKMQPGDLVLIYGAVEDTTDQNLRAQALGFLQVTNEICDDRSRMSDESFDWKLQRGFQDRWTHGIKVNRAWRIANRVHIRSIAPASFDNNFRFERTRRAKKLDLDEVRLALSHVVREVPVFGEPLITTSQTNYPLLQFWSPSRGPAPSFGNRASNYSDSESFVYLMVLEGLNEKLLGRNPLECICKVGRANEPKERLREINFGFPPSSNLKWNLVRSEKFESQTIAHDVEQSIINTFDESFRSEGGEFFSGPRKTIESVFSKLCTDNLHKIMSASGRASGA